jgi:hypothetical protein
MVEPKSKEQIINTLDENLDIEEIIFVVEDSRTRITGARIKSKRQILCYPSPFPVDTMLDSDQLATEFVIVTFEPQTYLKSVLTKTSDGRVNEIAFSFSYKSDN